MRSSAVLSKSAKKTNKTEINNKNSRKTLLSSGLAFLKRKFVVNQLFQLSRRTSIFKPSTVMKRETLQFFHYLKCKHLSNPPGCLEHSFAMFEALLDAKFHQRQIVVSWLDLKNAYGSVRHN